MEGQEKLANVDTRVENFISIFVSLYLSFARKDNRKGFVF